MVGRERELGVLGGLSTRPSRRARRGWPSSPDRPGSARAASSARPSALGSIGAPRPRVLRGRCPAVGRGSPTGRSPRSSERLRDLARRRRSQDAETKLRGRSRLLGSPVVDRRRTSGGRRQRARDHRRHHPGRQPARPGPAAGGQCRAGARLAPRLALAARPALIVVIEDLHWASELAVECSSGSSPGRPAPILLVITARPEFAEAQPGLVRRARRRRRDPAARGRSDGASRRLLGGLLPDRRRPPTRDRVLGDGRGQPPVHRGDRRPARRAGSASDGRAAGRWPAIGDLRSRHDPGLLAARIDTLRARGERVLREASVIGRVFWARATGDAIVAAIVDSRWPSSSGAASSPLRPTSTISGQVEYAFKHALIRDVAYAGCRWRAGRSLMPPSRAGSRRSARTGGWARGAGRLPPRAGAGRGGGPRLDRRVGRARGSPARRSTGFPPRRPGGTETLRAGAGGQPSTSAPSSGRDAQGASDRARGPRRRPRCRLRRRLAVAPWKEALEWALMPGGGPHVARLSMKIAQMAAIMWGAFTTPVDPTQIDATVDLGRRGRPRPGGPGLARRCSGPPPGTASSRSIARTASRRRTVGRHSRRLAPTPTRATTPCSGSSSFMSPGDSSSSWRHRRQPRGDPSPARDVGEQLDDPRSGTPLIEAGLTLSWVAGEAREMVEPMGGRSCWPTISGRTT